MYNLSGWHVGQELPEYLESHNESSFLYQISDLCDLALDGINKIFYTGKHETLLTLEKLLVSLYSDKVGIAFSRDDCLEVMPKDVHKGNAVVQALDVLGVDPADAVAFGDGMNDYEMLAMVGHGVVMENASERLQRALPNLPRAGSCDQDGVALYLERLFN